MFVKIDKTIQISQDFLVLLETVFHRPQRKLCMYTVYHNSIFLLYILTFVFF